MKIRIEGTGNDPVILENDSNDLIRVHDIINRVGPSGLLILASYACEHRAKLAQRTDPSLADVWFENAERITEVSEQVSDI